MSETALPSEAIALGRTNTASTAGDRDRHAAGAAEAARLSGPAGTAPAARRQGQVAGREMFEFTDDAWRAAPRPP